MTEADRLREELRDLHLRHASGDVPARTFERRAAEGGLALIRAVAASRLEGDERVLAEHHVTHAHLRLAESVLREPEQEVVSLFATGRRLLRLRSRLSPRQPMSCDHDDRTEIADLRYPDIARAVTRREVRWGEAAAGVVIVAMALLLGDWLQVTGTLLVGLGAAGILHALFLPTRWVELQPRDPEREPWRVSAVGRKSGRRLLAVVRGRALSLA
jgi:hypothetical protein